MFSLKLHSLREFPLEIYSFDLSLDRLSLGIDNIRYDVHLSPGFCEAAAKTVSQLMGRHSQAERILRIDKAPIWAKKRDDFKSLYRDMMLEAIRKSKSSSEVQIDFLAQIAIVKMLREEIHGQFEILITRIKNIIRGCEIQYHQDLDEVFKAKEELSHILQNRESIIRNASKELFQYLTEVQRKDLEEMRETNFGVESLLPDNVLSNPILQTENPYNQFFTIQHYDIVISRRVEDPDNYVALLLLVRSLLSTIDKKDLAGAKLSRRRAPIPGQEDEVLGNARPGARDLKIDCWIKQVDNINVLINCFQSNDRHKILKKQKGVKKELRNLKKLAKKQRKLLNFFYRKFHKAGLIERIAASFEMRPVYLDYCPPLVPQEIIDFLISPNRRKIVSSKLKRLRKFYDKPFPLRPLRKTIKNLMRLTTRKKKEYLIRFLNGIARYHRDLQNHSILKDIMDRVNLTSEEKIMRLSRENNTLYEFLLPHEQVLEEKPIRSHVIIKADVRGSTYITHQMNLRGLNPGSYLYLSFFDPISEILSEYGAVKVFIEGDSIILSIFERENTLEERYGVARACGIAVRMLIIVQRCNAKNRKYKLPILELGIGISYQNTPPAFIFDGEKRIMISPAINLAHRLSCCTRSIRKIMDKNKRPFNLYVFQTEPEQGTASTTDNLFVRYNVNGIELSASGFEKLSEEIKLRVIEGVIPNLQEEKVKLYTGKFPTVTRKYQRLVIREAQIPEVVPDELSIIRMTPRKYYEVCSNPKVYEYVRQMS